MIQGYASWTGTRTTLAALHTARWRLLMSPDTLNRCRGKTYPRWPDGSPTPYALDNGAWGCFQQDRDFDARAFRWALSRIGDGADWIVIPDIVEGGLESLRFSESWLPELLPVPSVLLLAVQDGMTPPDVDHLVSSSIGIFLGGSTDWKLDTMREWGAFAADKKAHFHVGRVNTTRRIYRCTHAGAHSFDGTSVTRFSCNITKLNNARKQLALWERI